MPIKYIHRITDDDSYTCPTFICDYCEQPITELRDGLAMVPRDRDGNLLDPIFVHREREERRTRDQKKIILSCDSILDRQMYRDKGILTGWMDLEDFAFELVRRMPDARDAFAKALKLTQRDIWLLHWISAGMPDKPLIGQPKNWQFDFADLAPLARKLEAFSPTEDNNAAMEDDLFANIEHDITPPQPDK